LVTNAKGFVALAAALCTSDFSCAISIAVENKKKIRIILNIF